MYTRLEVCSNSARAHTHTHTHTHLQSIVAERFRYRYSVSRVFLLCLPPRHFDHAWPVIAGAPTPAIGPRGPRPSPPHPHGEARGTWHVFVTGQGFVVEAEVLSLKIVREKTQKILFLELKFDNSPRNHKHEVILIFQDDDLSSL